MRKPHTSLPRFAGALSTEPRSEVAEEQVIERLETGLDGAALDLLAVFVSHHHGVAIEGLGRRLAALTGARVVVGCTGESIIGGGREVEHEPALAAWAAHLPGTELRPLRVTAEPNEGGEATFSALPDVRDPARASLLVVADPFSFPMDEYLQRLNEAFPGVPAVGGMASGGMGPGQNLLFDGSQLYGEGALGVVLEGDIEVASVVSQGCRPVGRPWVVTACQGNLVQRLGGQPAVDVLMETVHSLSERDRELFQRAPFVGLAIDPTKSLFERADFLVRGIVGLQPKERAVAIADLPRRGMTLQFLLRDARSASEDLEALMRSRVGNDGGAPSGAACAGALLFSCNGRGSRMFEEHDHDVRRVRAALSDEVPVAGFFAMGEIGPVGGRNFLHGFTASVAVFRPRPTS
jgi:small ligand-binding sensory domain FIST